MPLPPMPSSGLKMASPYSCTKSRSTCGDRVTVVAAIMSGCFRIAIFSLLS